MKHGRASLRGCRLALCAGLALLATPLSPASAHGQRAVPPGPTTGITIPNLTHGQMRVIAEHRSAIMALAAQQFPTDPVLRRLQGFIDLQSFTCAWGLVPGSLTDEDSPFNECSHAELAAVRAVLLHLRSMPGDRAPVSSLVATIEAEMLQNGASLVLCRFSDEAFNTATVINPSLGIVPLDPINVARLTIATMLLGWAGVTAMRGRRRFGGGARLRSPASTA